MEVPRGKKHNIISLKANSVAWTADCDIMHPAEIWQASQGEGPLKDQRLILSHGNMVTLWDHWPKIDPIPYWIRCFYAYKPNGTQGSGAYE